jgi:hypothetical protein
VLEVVEGGVTLYKYTNRHVNVTIHHFFSIPGKIIQYAILTNKAFGYVTLLKDQDGLVY